MRRGPGTTRVAGGSAVVRRQALPPLTNTTNPFTTNSFVSYLRKICPEKDRRCVPMWVGLCASISNRVVSRQQEPDTESKFEFVGRDRGAEATFRTSLGRATTS